MSEIEHDAPLDIFALEKLPDFAALRQVKDALWQLEDVHGAAVMVGAGFSRFAKLAAATTPRPPLWNTFRDAMLRDLYPSGGGPTDPLVLAEEYRATLGHGGLEGIIRKHVRDTEWEPGELHGKLLRLPWADVLTTNWDTLLERSAASDPDVSYSVVRVTADIARASRPRIVKLHGSVPSYLPFIFTEEDFRTYPERFAPYVNLAQQTLLENELCLIGFSGEDPNFLKWAGWVRDKLGDAARPIRLIGVLNLAPSRRRLFEARNITPIDLYPLVSGLPRDDQHQRAMDVLLEFLWRSRPSVKVEWKLADEKDYNLPAAGDHEGRVIALTSGWRRDRENHPGWLVTPHYQRFRGRQQVQDAFRVLADNIGYASPASRSALLFEVMWRWDTTFWTIPPFLEETAEKSLAAGEDAVLSESQRVLLHSTMARLARHRRDWPMFETRMARLATLSSDDARTEYLYELCLRARDDLDHEYILENAPLLEGHDPIWGLRRAALLAEILETEAAAQSIQATLNEIRRRRSQDRRSLWLLSREAWASYLMRSAWFQLRKTSRSEYRHEWPLAYKAAETDPWDELNHLGDDLDQSEQRKRSDLVAKSPQFDPGRYRVNSGTRFITAAVSTPLEQINNLVEQVGLPLRLGSAGIMGGRWVRAISDADDSVLSWLAMRSVMSGEKEALEEFFGRVAIARLDKGEVDQMVSRLKAAISFGRSQMAKKDEGFGSWASQIRAMCELLSRLCMRLSGDQAIDCFQLAASLLKDNTVQHWWLLEGIDHLLTRSVQALEPGRRRELALEVLQLPIPGEVNFGGPERYFPEASELLDTEAWSAREHSFGWNSRIGQLLNAANGSDIESRRHAVFRLLRLYEAGVLTDSESGEFGKAIWSNRGSDNLGLNTSLLPHVFLRLPSPDPDAPARLFEGVINTLADGSYDYDLIASLHSASFDLRHKYVGFPLQPERAKSILSSLLQWQPKPQDRDGPFSHNNDGDNEYTELMIARVLSSTVLPSVASEAVDDAVFDGIFARITDGTMPSLILALPALIKRYPAQTDRAYKAIRTGLLGGQSRPVQAALNAMMSLASRFEEDGTPVLETLVSEVITLCFMRREPGLVSALRVATKLVEVGAVSDLERTRLAEGMELIMAETGYGSWEDRSRWADVGLIRRGAAKLSHALKKAGGTAPVLDLWLDQVAGDPLPEVRYSLEEVD